MIKLICCDVDGTIVPDGSRDINPEFYQVIRSLTQRGICFTIASGRPVSSIMSLMEPVRDCIHAIALGGAMVADGNGPLIHWSMDQEDMRAIVKETRQIPGLDAMLYGEDCCYLDTRDDVFYDWVSKSYRMKCRRVEDLLAVDAPIVSMTVYDGSFRIEESSRDIAARWQDRYHMVTSGTMWLDIARRDVSKGKAVQYLQDRMGIFPEETMAFGDQRNDIQMLQQAYYSYAVDNALDEVKEIARFRTDRCDRDGVLQVLRQLLAQGDVRESDWEK